MLAEWAKTPKKGRTTTDTDPTWACDATAYFADGAGRGILFLFPKAIEEQALLLWVGVAPSMGFIATGFYLRTMLAVEFVDRGRGQFQVMTPDIVNRANTAGDMRLTIETDQPGDAVKLLRQIFPLLGAAQSAVATAAFMESMELDEGSHATARTISGGTADEQRWSLAAPLVPILVDREMVMAATTCRIDEMPGWSRANPSVGGPITTLREDSALIVTNLRLLYTDCGAYADTALTWNWADIVDIRELEGNASFVQWQIVVPGGKYLVQIPTRNTYFRSDLTKTAQLARTAGGSFTPETREFAPRWFFMHNTW